MYQGISKVRVYLMMPDESTEIWTCTWRFASEAVEGPLFSLLTSDDFWDRNIKGEKNLSCWAEIYCWPA